MNMKHIGMSLLAVLCAAQVACIAADDGDGDDAYATEDAPVAADEGVGANESAASEGAGHSDPTDKPGPKASSQYGTHQPESVANVTDTLADHAPDPEDTIEMFTGQCAGREDCRD